jgi:hypothetical protein
MFLDNHFEEFGDQRNLWNSPVFGESEKRNLIDYHQEGSMGKSQPTYSKEFKRTSCHTYVVDVCIILHVSSMTQLLRLGPLQNRGNSKRCRVASVIFLAVE